MAQLICEDLTLGYEGQEILSHLSFSVEKGDYLCIIGENGSGKTTLMKTILGQRYDRRRTQPQGDRLPAAAEHHSARLSGFGARDRALGLSGTVRSAPVL